jgi:hypothetical protein
MGAGVRFSAFSDSEFGALASSSARATPYGNDTEKIGFHFGVSFLADKKSNLCRKRSNPLFDFRQHKRQVNQGTPTQWRSADLAGLIVKMMRRCRNGWVVWRIVPAQKRLVAKKLIRIILKRWLVVQPNLELVIVAIRVTCH